MRQYLGLWFEILKGLRGNTVAKILAYSAGSVTTAIICLIFLQPWLLEMNHGLQPIADSDPIYIVMPTYPYLARRAHLTRLLWQFSSMHIVWILIEDNSKTEKHVEDLIDTTLNSLERQGIHRHQGFRIMYLANKRDYSGAAEEHCRGLISRNLGLEKVFSLANDTRRGWLYFGDDDNSYSPMLFEEIRKVKKVGVWPVGNMGPHYISSPLIDDNGLVAKFHDPWMVRTYPLDMAGFAFSMEYLMRKNVSYWKWSSCEPGAMETEVLEKALSGPQELEPLADKCSKVVVWHTRTTSGSLDAKSYELLMKETSEFSNARELLREYIYVPHQVARDPKFWK